MRTLPTLFVLFVLLAGVAASPAADLSVYHIGNSLSQDMWHAFPPLALQFVRDQGGKTYEWGYHFRPATGISYIHHHPDADGTKSQVGPWNKALAANHWDVVTMQPYYPTAGEPSTLATDTAAIADLIAETRKNPANAATRFFIYAAWPPVAAGDPASYAKSYLAAVRNVPEQNSTLARDYIGDLCAAVRKTDPGLGVIPIGEVIYAIDVKMQAGKIPGFSSILQLHRDVNHVNGLGHNVAAWTTYAAICGKSPLGLAYQDLQDKPVAGFSNPTLKDIAPEAVAAMQQAVWEVVNGPASVKRSAAGAK